MVRQLVALHDEKLAPFRLPSEGTVTIGRRLGNNIVCADVSVSGQHCSLTLKSGQAFCEVEDCSSNGTFVNEIKLSKGEKQTVKDGDVLSLTKPIPAGANDGDVSPPPPRVQFRVDFRLEDSDNTPEDPPSPTSLSQPPAAPRRGATTAEGFAQDLLLQEQQCKAKITGELLLARRRLDEERSRSEALSRDLKKAKAALEEERSRRSSAQTARDSFRSEVSQLQADRQKLQDLRPANVTLRGKHEAVEVQLTTEAQRSSNLESAIERLKTDIAQLQEGGSASSSQLAAAQERLQKAQEEAAGLEERLETAKQAESDAQREADRLQRLLRTEQQHCERLEDQHALLSGEVERAEESGRLAQEHLAEAQKEIEALEQRAARSTREAEAERQAAIKADSENEVALKTVMLLRDAAIRFAHGLSSCSEKWLQTLPEVVAASAPSAASRSEKNTQGAQQKAEASAKAVDGPNKDSTGPAKEDRQKETEEVAVDSTPLSQEVATQPSLEEEPVAPILAAAMPVPESQPLQTVPSGEAPPQRLWSVAVLGGTAAGAAESLDDDSDDEHVPSGVPPAPKRQRISLPPN
eukprot:TRINITY_DN82069_c0_g1_i1.p1 TRINITY_DN82069_c0_g1~~TRINITY_DN82069_c0_g1_i1.p1  ORF type:complete len:580 (+),score=158.26 TRINITY_DN82069_c0_g1_i1:46-1785(+)